MTGIRRVSNLGTTGIASIVDGSVVLGTDTTGNYVSTVVAGTAISVSGATGNVTVTNSGVTSMVAGTGVAVSGATGAVTTSIGQSVATSAKPTFAGISTTAASEFLTEASAGRGVGIKAPAGDGSPAILQFTNNAVSAQWGSISVTNNRMSLNAVVLHGAQPYFIAGSATGSSGSSVVKVGWTGSYYGNDFSTASSQYNVPVSGLYFFSTQVRINGATAGGYMRCAIVRNNGTVYAAPNLHAIFGSAHSSDYHSMAVSGVMYCVAGDNVSVWAGREGGASSFDAESTFTGWLLG